MRITRRRAVTAVLTATAIAVGALTASTTAAHASDPIRVAVAGDSLTAFSNSWRYQLNDPGVSFVGGFAQAGATTWGVSQNIQPVPGADVLVVMLGTNDVKYAVNTGDVSTHIEDIVRTVGAAHVLLSYLPPSDITSDANGIDHRNKNLVYSRALVALAQRHGWLMADPFAAERNYLGGYASGTTDDGVHPNTASFGLEAARMDTYIHQAYLAAQP